VACGIDGDTDAETCAAKHWAPILGARRERNLQWRAPCPVPGCKSLRALEFDAPGLHVRWKSFCGLHPKEVVRPYLVKLVGACMPGGSRRKPVKHGDLIALALADIPPMTKNLRMLEMAGISTDEALRMLGVLRNHRARVIAGKTGGAPKRAQNPHPNG
jgi:hypothetical protein